MILPLDFGQHTGAVADVILWNAGLVKDGEEQVRHRRVLRVRQVTAGLESAAEAAGEGLFQKARLGFGAWQIEDHERLRADAARVGLKAVVDGRSLRDLITNARRPSRP